MVNETEITCRKYSLSEIDGKSFRNREEKLRDIVLTYHPGVEATWSDVKDAAQFYEAAEKIYLQDKSSAEGLIEEDGYMWDVDARDVLEILSTKITFACRDIQVRQGCWMIFPVDWRRIYGGKS